MDAPRVRQILAGPYQVFAYIVACPKSLQAVVIDPGGEPEKIEGAIREEGLTVSYILNTHGHEDHMLANAALKSRLGSKICLHEADVSFFYGKASGKGSASIAVDIPLTDGETLRFGNLQAKVIHTPGHTPGSVCYLVGKHLFTGDTLFVGAAGRTDLPGGSLDELLESIRQKLLSLPGETVIWPGHDYGETSSSTMERERRENVYITDFLLEEE